MEKTSKSSRKRTTKTAKRRKRIAKEVEEGEDKIIPKRNNLTEESRAKGHQYCLSTIQFALQSLISGNISLRSIEKILEISQGYFQKTPQMSTIRNWFLRVGLYELQKPKEYRNDWIFIMDITVELGHQKALVILGISQKDLQEIIENSAQSLSHQDVKILALEIMNSTKGEFIEKKLNELSEKVGNPIQIVADHASDLASGIKRYQQNHPEVIYTHDVTHGMALILKHELINSEKYQSFLKHCHQCRKELQQTELSFLSPPNQRSKCRFFNVERLVDWAVKIEKSPWDTLRELVPNIEENILRKKIGDKFAWIVDYEEDLKSWSLMVKMTRTLENQLKTLGINQESLSNFEKIIGDLTAPKLSEFKQNIVNYLIRETIKISNTNTFLATSDVLESLFGKYKIFSERSPLKQISPLLLTIILSTTTLTTNFIKEALENIRFIDVETWVAQAFGSSALSKRKTLFSASLDDTEFV